jgi:hypothetical protein
MNRYIRSYLNDCEDVVTVSGQFALARGERIKKISTTFAPSCACVSRSATPSSITFGGNILNTGYITPPLIGVNECDIVSVADVDNLVVFVFVYSLGICEQAEEVCCGQVQVAFEIESDNLDCPNPPARCDIKITNNPQMPFTINQVNAIHWTCSGCLGAVDIAIVNLTNPFIERLSRCGGGNVILCSDGVANWIPSPLHYSQGDIVHVTITCCVGDECNDEGEFIMEQPQECYIVSTREDVGGWTIGQPNDINWLCNACQVGGADSNVLITVHNLTTLQNEELTACVPDGLPIVLCSTGTFFWTPDPILYTVDDRVVVEVCCCGIPDCCGLAPELPMLLPA